jgi:very-short-patch-repair endonuclease
MPRPPRRPASLQNTAFLGAPHRRTGVLTADTLRSGAWRHLYRDTFADAEIEPTHGLRCASARLVIPPGAAIGGRSAAWLHGIELVTTEEPVEVITPIGANFGPVRGLTIRTTDLPAADVIERDRLRFTTPERTAWDLARFNDTPEAVAYLDAMLRARLIQLPALQARLRATTVRWGSRRVAVALGLVDHRAESPQESRLRVKLTLARLPRPVPQYDVALRGRFVARVDLAWPARRVAVEYDGTWHADTGQFHRDRRRLNQLAVAGWTVIHVTAVRMHEDFAGVVDEVRAALAATR